MEFEFRIFGIVDALACLLVQQVAQLFPVKRGGLGLWKAQIRLAS